MKPHECTEECYAMPEGVRIDFWCPEQEMLHARIVATGQVLWAVRHYRDGEPTDWCGPWREVREKALKAMAESEVRG